MLCLVLLFGLLLKLGDAGRRAVPSTVLMVHLHVVDTVAMVAMVFTATQNPIDHFKVMPVQPWVAQLAPERLLRLWVAVLVQPFARHRRRSVAPTYWEVRRICSWGLNLGLAGELVLPHVGLWARLWPSCVLDAEPVPR